MNVRASIRGNLHGLRLAHRQARRFVAPIVAFLALTLSGCASTESAAIIAAPRAVDATQAMVLPAPGGPSIVSVIEARFSDGVRQKIILGTDATNPGQNYLEIRLYGPMEREVQGHKKLGFRAFTAAGLSAEAFRAVPGVSMKVSQLFLRNTYGPIGYAFGRSSGGDGCIFGWQQLRSGEDERAGFRNGGAIQIRLRLCQSGAGEKELLSVLYGYTINGSFSSEQWNPFGAPKDVSSTIGTGGDPIFPRDSELSAFEKPAARPVRNSRPVEVPRDETTVQENSPDDETEAKSIVNVPMPEDVASDSDNAAADQSPVLVPEPGCEDGNLSCN